MKDYLKEDLSESEKGFIYGIIRNTSLKFIREVKKIEKREVFSLDGDNVPEDILIDDATSDLLDKILDTKILRDISVLNPYSQYEKEKIVETFENVARNCGLERLLTLLTFNEKLMVFLLYIENYQVNEISILLGISRIAIWKRDKSIKNKINKLKGEMNNGQKSIQ